jgi:predicted DNA-binding transcriptional regulator AlpA
MQQLNSELIKVIPQSIPEALASFDQLPDSAYVRLNTVRRLYGVSAATIWRNCKKRTMPCPVKLSERCTAWSVKALRADLAAKAAA